MISCNDFGAKILNLTIVTNDTVYLDRFLPKMQLLKKYENASLTYFQTIFFFFFFFKKQLLKLTFSYIYIYKNYLIINDLEFTKVYYLLFIYMYVVINV
jgi:hypothetical protein